MKDTIKMIAALVVFATVACVALAFVYEATKSDIAANNTRKTEAAQKELFPRAQFEDITGQIKSGDSAVLFTEEYAARENGALTGVIIAAASAGFNAPLVALVGVGADGVVAGVQMLSNTDTPGLGAHASNPSYYVDKPAKTKTFYGQFTGMRASDSIAVEKDGGSVVAITAATITSRAVALLVAEAARRGGEWLNENGGVQ
ncbi:MAG: FMN-binding protein [Spirochaetaceae bacterium]|jgi:electron transport complex protein RnfG|nr:FMN-binding protein [Spirochaetaceae bacterium]